MKKFVILSAILFVAVFILLPAITNGKYNVSKPLVVDGGPMPPPFPPSSIAMATTDTLVADRNALLPLPPNPSYQNELVADGGPMPPPFPPKPPLNLMIA